MTSNWLEAYLMEAVRKELCTKILCTTCGALEFRQGVLSALSRRHDDATDLDLFVKWTAAIERIDEGKLVAAMAERDPVQIKRTYSKLKSEPGFESLIQIVRADPANVAKIAEKINSTHDPKVMDLSIDLTSSISHWYRYDRHRPYLIIDRGDALEITRALAEITPHDPEIAAGVMNILFDLWNGPLDHGEIEALLAGTWAGNILRRIKPRRAKGARAPCTRGI
jgi:hypothetical protein